MVNVLRSSKKKKLHIKWLCIFILPKSFRFKLDECLDTFEDTFVDTFEVTVVAKKWDTSTVSR